jgi:hypothetical protein
MLWNKVWCSTVDQATHDCDDACAHRRVWHLPRAETEPALAAWNALLAWAQGRGLADSVRRELWAAVCQWGAEARGRGEGQEGAFTARALMSAIDRLGCTELVNSDAWPCVPFVPCDGIGCAVRCLHAPMFLPASAASIPHRRVGEPKVCVVHKGARQGAA